MSISLIFVYDMNLSCLDTGHHIPCANAAVCTIITTFLIGSALPPSASRTMTKDTLNLRLGYMIHSSDNTVPNAYLFFVSLLAHLWSFVWVCFQPLIVLGATNENRVTSSRAKEKQPGLLNIKLEDTKGASVIGRQSFSSALPWNANLQGLMIVYYLLSYSHLHLSGSTQVRLCSGLSNLDD